MAGCDARCFLCSPKSPTSCVPFLSSALSPCPPSNLFSFFENSTWAECVVLIGCQAELPEYSSEAKPTGLCQSWRRHRDIMSATAAGKRLLNQLGCVYKKTEGDWLSHVAHHLQSVTSHGSSHLILCKINISCHGFLDASPWIKQHFLSQKSSLKVVFNESDAAFVSIDSLLAPLFFVPPARRASYGTLWKTIMTELLKITISQSGILVSAVSAAKE